MAPSMDTGNEEDLGLAIYRQGQESAARQQNFDSQLVSMQKAHEYENQWVRNLLARLPNQMNNAAANAAAEAVADIVGNEQLLRIEATNEKNKAVTEQNKVMKWALCLSGALLMLFAIDGLMVTTRDLPTPIAAMIIGGIVLVAFGMMWFSTR